MKKVILCIMIFGLVTSIIGCSGSEPEQSEIDNYIAMGDVLKSGKVEWKVTSKQIRDSVGTQLEAIPGVSYWVLYVEAKNVYSESITFMEDGILWIRPAGTKKMIQYTSKFNSGFGYAAQEVNPFVPANRKVAFAVPEGLEGDYFYQPPLASSKERIKLS